MLQLCPAQCHKSQTHQNLAVGGAPKRKRMRPRFPQVVEVPYTCPLAPSRCLDPHLRDAPRPATALLQESPHRSEAQWVPAQPLPRRSPTQASWCLRRSWNQADGRSCPVLTWASGPHLRAAAPVKPCQPFGFIAALHPAEIPSGPTAAPWLCSRRMKIQMTFLVTGRWTFLATPCARKSAASAS